MSVNMDRFRYDSFVIVKAYGSKHGKFWVNRDDGERVDAGPFLTIGAAQSWIDGRFNLCAEQEAA
jgi:hypothetical protein